MLKRLLLFSCVFLLLAPALSGASSHFTFEVLETKEEVFENRNCKATDTCDLKSARIKAIQYRIEDHVGEIFGTTLYAWYHTAPEALEKYVFVQFIRGCAFVSKQNADGEIIYRRNRLQKFFDKHVRFRHPTWVIDSMDTDPVYFSDSSLDPPRHFLYLWNTPRHSTNQTTKKFYGSERPAFPELYVTDHPSQGIFFPKSGRANNTSLEFRIGVYRASDVPLETTPDNINFAEPVALFSWKSSWIYNHEAETYESPEGIHEFCGVE